MSLQLLYIHFLQLSSAVEVLKTLLNTLGHGLLALSDPDSGIVVLLVWFVLTIWVSDRLLEVVMLVLEVISHAGHVGILHVGIQVDLDDTVADSV